MIEHAQSIAFALAMLIARPDLTVAWDAPADGSTPVYELQVATNLAQFNCPPMIGGQPSPNGIGCIVFTGQTLWLTNNLYPVYFAEAPQRFYRVRAWNDFECSDWALVRSNLSTLTSL